MTESEIELHCYEETVKRKAQGISAKDIASYCRGFRKLEKVKKDFPVPDNVVTVGVIGTQTGTTWGFSDGPS